MVHAILMMFIWTAIFWCYSDLILILMCSLILIPFLVFFRRRGFYLMMQIILSYWSRYSRTIRLFHTNTPLNWSVSHIKLVIICLEVCSGGTTGGMFLYFGIHQSIMDQGSTVHLLYVCILNRCHICVVLKMLLIVLLLMGLVLLLVMSQYFHKKSLAFHTYYN